MKQVRQEPSKMKWMQKEPSKIGRMRQGQSSLGRCRRTRIDERKQTDRGKKERFIPLDRMNRENPAKFNGNHI